jgi:hypothetical protein
MKIIPIKKAEELIPEGMYCYTPLQAPCEETNWVYKVKPCPFWEYYSEEKHGKLPEGYPSEKEYDGAFCQYLKAGDWNGTDLLWDQVKECGVKYE